MLMMQIQQIRTLGIELRMTVDRAAEFESVALPHATNLLRYAMHLDDRGKAEAEDLVQETLLAAWRNFDQFEAGTNCKAWLFRILINLRYKQLRRTSRKPEVPLDQEESGLSQPENITLNVEMRDAFAKLSPEHREVMQLAVVEGFEIREVAAMLRIPAGTVMSRLGRARAQLRAVLQASSPSREEAV
jgi:RNA polymerase sigma-70 factor (ECF subfamily)